MHPNPLSRRDVFKLLAAASAAGAMPGATHARPPSPLTREFDNPLGDPDYSNPVVPWEKPLGESELKTLGALVDRILPGDDESPAPTEIGLPDFLNEWVGAPYSENRADYETIRGGLAWLNHRARQLHGGRFEELPEEHQTAMLDSICDPAEADPELAPGCRFFRKLRMLTLGGYYSHSSTWKSLGYVGNVAIGGPYPGVPDEIIKLLGLEGV